MRKSANVNLQDYYDEKALHIAAKYEMHYIFKQHSHYSANDNIGNERNKTAPSLTNTNLFEYFKILIKDSK